MIQPSRHFIPKNDSLSSYPHMEISMYINVIVIFLTIPFPWILLTIMHILQRYFPKRFKFFRLGTAIWIHTSSILLPCIFSMVLCNFVGRVRPDFYSRCGNKATKDTCTILSNKELRDEFRSFPSISSTMAVSSMTFFSLFLLKLCIDSSTWLHCIFLIPLIKSLI